MENAAQLLASVDLGSNSFRLQICQNNNGQPQVVENIKQMVRFAGGLDANKTLDEASQERALECLAQFGERLRGFPPEQVRAVATNTFRVAKNIGEFLPKAEAALGFPIEVIAGREEARLIYTGVVHTFPNNGQKMLVVDIGGGTTEVGVISLSGVVYSHSIRVGGDTFDEAIIQYVRRNYGMLIGEASAEEIKKRIGSAFPSTEVSEMEVKGRNLAEGIPRSFTITSNEVLEALADPLSQIVQAVRSALEQTPPELGADIAERGLVLTGGGALLKGLDRLLAEETGLPVLIAEDALTCVARGSGKALELIGKMNSVFVREF